MSRKAAVIAAVVLAVLVVGGIFLSRSPLARINFAGSLGSGGRANVRVPPGFTIEVFADGLLVPTGENLARFIFERVQAALGDAARVTEVVVAEDATLRCAYRGEGT